MKKFVKFEFSIYAGGVEVAPLNTLTYLLTYLLTPAAKNLYSGYFGSDLVTCVPLIFRRPPLF